MDRSSERNRFSQVEEQPLATDVYCVPGIDRDRPPAVQGTQKAIFEFTLYGIPSSCSAVNPAFRFCPFPVFAARRRGGNGTLYRQVIKNEFRASQRISPPAGNAGQPSDAPRHSHDDRTLEKLADAG